MHNKAIGFMVINPCKLSNTSLSYNSSHYIHRSYLCLSRTANFAGSSVFCDLLLEGLGVFFCAFNLHFHRKLSEINCKCTYSTAFIIHIIIHNCIWYFLDCYMVWYEYTIKEYVSNYPKKKSLKKVSMSLHEYGHLSIDQLSLLRTCGR